MQHLVVIQDRKVFFPQPSCQSRLGDRPLLPSAVCPTLFSFLSLLQGLPKAEEGCSNSVLALPEWWPSLRQPCLSARDCERCPASTRAGVDPSPGL